MSLLPLEQHFSKFSNNTFYQLEESNITFSQFYENIKKRKEFLKKEGLKESTRVALIDSTSLETLYNLFALWELKISVVMLSSKIPFDQRQSYLSSAPCSHLLENNKIIELTYKPKLIKDEFLFIFTSGSSGKPKAVTLSEENLYFSAKGSNEFYKLNSSDCWLLSLPLYHVGGLLIAIRSLLAGASFEDEFNHSNILSLVPTQLQRLLEKQTEVEKLLNSKAILLGGAPCSEELFKEIKDKKLPISLTYGQTEATAQLTATSPFVSVDDLHCGKELPYRELLIDNDKHICFSGRTRFLGYLENDKLHTPFDNDGFFKSQDLGRIQNQNLFVSGRADSIFISGGENISPKEIQKALLSIDGIVEAIIIPINHKEFGQVPFAFYKCETPYSSKELKDLLRDLLPSYKIPKYFYHLNKEPKAGIKFSKEELYDLANSFLESK